MQPTSNNFSRLNKSEELKNILFEVDEGYICQSKNILVPEFYFIFKKLLFRLN